MKFPKNHYKKKINISKTIPLIVIIIVMMITIGFSAFQASLMVTDIGATVRVQKDIRVTSIRASNPIGQAISNWEDYNVHSFKSSISLPNANSKITYNVEITNFGNVEAGILSITGLPNNLTYSISNYTLQNTLCDDNDSSKCKLGSVSTLEITIEYAENAYDNTNTTFNFEMDFEFFYIDAIARIGNNYYDTLQQAIDNVPTTNVQTEVILLKNTSELITISAGKNVLFNLQNNTLSNVATNSSVIENYGSLKMTNGTISTNATQGAINVYGGASFNISGGRIMATGNRQAIYNNGGTVTISGNAYLSNTTNQRAAVQNQANSTLIITGGTIIASNFAAVNNNGNLTIGTKDGNVNETSPTIQGSSSGVMSSTNFNFYDGIIKGKTNAFENEAKITDKETGYGIYKDTEIINNVIYKTAQLAIVATVTFNPNEGTVSEPTRNVKKSTAIGFLPIPTREDYVFDGWFTAATGGTEITADTIITNDIEFFAQWTPASEVYVASMNGNNYSTLQAAITAAPANTQTTIKLLRNTIENVTVTYNKNIILNLQTHSITNSNNNAVITNNGTLKMISGTINTNSTSTAAVNNKANFTITGGSILATGARQAIYNDGGTLTISGSAYLRATTEVRATVQNQANSTITITGGTIVSTKQEAVSNAGTLTIGTKDGNIDITSPILQGTTHGVTNTSIFNFYDGILKGKNAAFSGTMNDTEQNSTVVNNTETIDGQTYNTAYLN